MAGTVDRDPANGSARNVLRAFHPRRVRRITHTNTCEPAGTKASTPEECARLADRAHARAREQLFTMAREYAGVLEEETPVQPTTASLISFGSSEPQYFIAPRFIKRTPSTNTLRFGITRTRLGRIRDHTKMTASALLEHMRPIAFAFAHALARSKRAR